MPYILEELRGVCKSVRDLVLAGGEGTRLKPLSLSLYEHLAPLLGKAVIECSIQHFVDADVRNTVLLSIV